MRNRLPQGNSGSECHRSGFAGNEDSEHVRQLQEMRFVSTFWFGEVLEVQFLHEEGC